MITAQYQRLNVNVSAPNIEVIRKAHKMLSSAGRSFALRDGRHSWLRAILQEHKDARDLALYVGTGSRAWRKRK